MDKAKELLKELEGIVGQTDAASINRQNEIAEWFKANPTADNNRMMDDFLRRGYSQIEKEAECLRNMIESDLYRIIPWSYIAHHYFGKTPAWLHQRINGSAIRGRVYTLNSEQKAILNNALKDIGRRIGEYRFA